MLMDDEAVSVLVKNAAACGARAGVVNVLTFPATVIRVVDEPAPAVPVLVTRKLIATLRCPSGAGKVDQTEKLVMTRLGPGI